MIKCTIPSIYELNRCTKTKKRIKLFRKNPKKIYGASGAETSHGGPVFTNFTVPHTSQ